MRHIYFENDILFNVNVCMNYKFDTLNVIK